MAFNRICTSVYRIYVICMAFGRMLCGKHHMLGFHPQSPERGRPRRRFEHGITFYLNLYVNLPCPREMGNAAITYTLPSERKTYTNPLQFKSFWGCRDLFSKRSRVVPRKHGVTGKPLCQKGFPRYHLLPSAPFPRFPASFSPRRQKQTDFSTVLLPFSHRPRCIISAKDRALPSPREKKKGRTRK